VPLIPPSLDDRSYDDIVQEMLANIPAHTPEWTNPQPGDPGRTLIELFAWLADTILYRANLIPEKQRIAFLQLLGQPMQPAAAATGLVSLALDPTATQPVGILSHAVVNGAANFETLEEVNVLPVTAQAYVKMNLTSDQKTAAMPLLQGLQKLYTLTNVPSGYTTTPVFPNNVADAAGVDLLQSTTDGSLWLALLVGSAQNLAAVQTALTTGEQTLNIGFSPSLTVPGLYSVPQQYDASGTPSPVQATWQMTQTPPVVAAGSTAPPVQYATLKVLSDTTAGLTQPGVVQVMLPAGIGAPPNDVRSDSQAGVGMKPPRIDDPAIAARLLTWVRLSVQTSVVVSWLGVNAVDIDQRKTLSSVVIGVSDGSASQAFALPTVGLGPVDASSFLLDVDMPGLGFTLWQQTDDLSILQGPATAYLLDPEASMVTFGNQLQGMIPPAGRRVRVRTMRAGGGVIGNLLAGSLTSIQAQDAMGNQVTQTITVQQPMATTGGEDTETLASAEQRLPALLQHQNRAVTKSDYSNLAQSIPGANIGRVEVLPLFKPQTQTPNVPGVVSVMVIPEKEGVLYPCPAADRPLLETVFQYLSPRTPIAAEMYVIASEYVELEIAVAVEVKTGYGLLAVSQAVETALRGYLWPLPLADGSGGGPDATGWPLGRSVRSLELEVIVSQVPGVIEVNGLNLFTPLGSGQYQMLTMDSSGRIELTLESWQMPQLNQVMVAAGPDGSGIQVATTLTPVLETDSSVAVPIVPNVC
jgi:predicted phage baseplate assembly protein